MKKITVKLKASPYNVLLEHGLLHQGGGQITKTLGKEPSFTTVVTSSRIRQLWGEKLESSLKQAKLKYAFVEIDDGEPAKHLANVEPLLRRFSQIGMDRNSLVVAFGGGVIGDSVGFAASIYMRGIRVVQVPTTLLAQVDAAIGGKTGVNLFEGKNLVGTFHQPSLVLIDPNVLKTLSDREYRAGLFEVIKCGVIRDEPLFEFLENHLASVLRRDETALMRIISDSVKIKAEIVAADEREGGLRRILNFGHTIGHALEADSNYKKFLHGEAVGWGMTAAAKIGVLCGITPVKVEERIAHLVSSLGPLPKVTASEKNMLRLVQADKKAVLGVPHFILAKQIGRVEITNKVQPSMIEAAIRELHKISASQTGH